MIWDRKWDKQRGYRGYGLRCNVFWISLAKTMRSLISNDLCRYVQRPHRSNSGQFRLYQSGRSPKVVALFSATNFSSYIIKLLQLHDKIQIKWNYAWIHYNIAIRRHLTVREISKSSSTFSATNTSSNIVWSISTVWYNPNEIKWNLIVVPNLVAFISQKEKNVCFFDYHSLTCSVRKMVLICLMQNIDMYLLYKSHQIARLVSHLINHFSKWMFTV